MTKVVEVNSDDPDRLEAFDALVRSVRDAVTNPDIPVDVRYERDEHQSVFTVTVHNLAGLQAKLDREEKEQRDRDAEIAKAAARDARAKEKLNAKAGVTGGSLVSPAKASVVDPVALEPTDEKWVPPGQEHATPEPKTNTPKTK